MNEKCRNGSCARMANVTAKWAGVGIRQFCWSCYESLKQLAGDDLQRLPEETVVPEWRKRSLAKAWLTR